MGQMYNETFYFYEINEKDYQWSIREAPKAAI